MQTKIEKVVKAIQTLIKSKGIELEATSELNLRVDGGRARSYGKVFADLEPIFSQEFGKAGFSDYFAMDDTSKTLAYKEVVRSLYQAKLEEEKEKEVVFESKMEEVRLAINVATGEFRTLSKSDEDITDKVHPDTIRHTMPIKEWNMAVQTAQLLVEVQDYKTPKTSWVQNYELTEGQALPDVLHLNKIIHPPWALKTKVEDFPNEIPEMIDIHLKHLFPDRDTRHNVLSWLKWAIMERNITCLALVGAAGVGKSILLTLAQELVGEKGTHIASRGFLDSDWNSGLRNKKLALYDEEGSLSRRAVDNLKAYVNDKITFNEKHKDNHKVDKLSCSHLLSCNEAEFYLTPTERKFSFVEMTSKRLDTLWSTDKITFYAEKYIRDPKIVAQFGWYLINYETEVTAYSDCRRGRKFWEVLFNSLEVGSLRYAMIEQLRSMSPDEPETEAEFMRKVRQAANLKARSGGMPINLQSWAGEFRAVGYPILDLYKEEDDTEGETMIRSLFKRSFKFWDMPNTSTPFNDVGEDDDLTLL